MNNAGTFRDNVSDVNIKKADDNVISNVNSNIVNDNNKNNIGKVPSDAVNGKIKA